MAQTVYSPKDVDISFGGAMNIDGWLSLTINRNAENTSKEVSADGKVGITYSADRTGTFEMEVQQQNNSVNAFFSAIQGAQDKNNAPLFYDITVTDKSGGFLGQMKECYLDTPASQDLGAEATGRTWGFFVTDLPYLPNPSGFEGATQAIANADAAVNTLKTNKANL